MTQLACYTIGNLSRFQPEENDDYIPIIHPNKIIKKKNYIPSVIPNGLPISKDIYRTFCLLFPILFIKKKKIDDFFFSN